MRTFYDHRSEFAAAVARAECNFYMDDLLLSLDSSSEATEMSQHLRQLLKRGGLHFTKWASNHKEVLRFIPSEERHVGIKELNLSQHLLPVERALGVTWNLENDQFAVKTQIQRKPSTKGGLTERCQFDLRPSWLHSSARH
ncbi:uncharacterized protein LOC121865929 [Homarus americanus]|uniref:uncharacterized protein LOC121865929 n=1 Tax=Homarus americanus TaxID=6706 RepID=UPI001C48EAE8|nr:uncharacterized protein LOC121865929 [Homarus americanus]